MLEAVGLNVLIIPVKLNEIHSLKGMPDAGAAQDRQSDVRTQEK